MAGKSRKPTNSDEHRTVLLLPRSEVENRIRVQVARGQELLKRKIDNPAEWEELKADYHKWNDYNCELMKRVASSDELIRSYRPTVGFSSTGREDWRQRLFHLCDNIHTRITHLESILGRLELIPEQGVDIAGFEPIAGTIASNRVFVVHGHDEEAKQAVARTIEKLGLEPVILQEQPNQGRTIIEKFEDYADVGFVVVLLTEDDLGTSIKAPENLRPRARQNVIFELGFFIGRLGRARVCALHKGNVEILSDFSGVLWVPIGPNGAWRFALAREMKAAGLEADLNKLV